MAKDNKDQKAQDSGKVSDENAKAEKPAVPLDPVAAAMLGIHLHWV